MADTKRSRRWPHAIAIILLGLLLVDTAVWALACLRADQTFRDALTNARSAGWTISAGPARWGGWPLAAAIELPSVEVVGDQSVFPPGLRWTAARLTLRVSALHPATLVAVPYGGQTIAAEGIAPVPFTAASMQAAFDLQGRAPTHVTLAGLAAILPGSTLRVEAGDLLLPADGAVIDLGAISVGAAPPIDHVHGRVTVAPLFPVSATPTESATRWRDGGGRIGLDDVALRWGALDAAGHLAIQLDAALQPVAAGQIEAAGLPAALDALAQSGALPRSDAVAAKAVLALLAAPSGGGRVSLPLALQGGTLSLGRIPLLRFPPLLWN